MLQRKKWGPPNIKVRTEELLGFLLMRHLVAQIQEYIFSVLNCRSFWQIEIHSFVTYLDV